MYCKRSIYTDVQRLISQNVQEEPFFLPFGKKYLNTNAEYEKPAAAAQSLVRASKKKPATPKAAGKRKAQPTPEA
jgi:hypothetical protein